MTVHVLVAGWSREDTSLACSMTLPSLLSPANLNHPRLQDSSCRATILCREVDKERYEEAAGFKQLADRARVDWHFVDDEVARLGSAREAVFSEASRRCMALNLGVAGATRFILLKPRMILADGTLPRVMQILDGDARVVLTPVHTGSQVALEGQSAGTSRSAQVLLSALMADPRVIRSGRLGLPFQNRYHAIDRAAVQRGAGWELVSARWHPLALLPDRVDPRRESLIDAEIVPEFAAAADHVYWSRGSDDLFLVEARSASDLDRTLSRDRLSFSAWIGELSGWITGWQAENLRHPFTLGADTVHDGADAPDSGACESTVALPAVRHPLWLAARGLRRLLGPSVRYASPIDDIYLASRDLIKSSTASAVIYSGKLEDIFAPLLVSSFDDVFLGEIERTISHPASILLTEESTLHVLYLEATELALLIESGRASRFVESVVHAKNCSAALIVNTEVTREDHLPIQTTFFDAWIGSLIGFGTQVAVRSTLRNGLHGHPGFLLRLGSAWREMATPPSSAFFGEGD